MKIVVHLLAVMLFSAALSHGQQKKPAEQPRDYKKELAEALDKIKRLEKWVDENKNRPVEAGKGFKDVKEFREFVESNRQLNRELAEKLTEIDEMREDHAKKLRKLNAQIQALQAQLKAAGKGGKAAKAPGQPLIPLLVDVTAGKPLWDNPVGKIIRVDLDLHQVAINLGSNQGVKPGLTFTIFGANAAGKAENRMKGSIEVIRVLNANTSLARITSLYDADGRELRLNDLPKSKIVRESEAPIRDGDLLFNMFWGARVAIAGYVNITGDPSSDHSADQVRQLEDFKHLLQRNGIQVDAYVSLRSGILHGRLTAKTRYVILGDDQFVSKPIQKATELLRKEAVEKGIILISAENFATVTGLNRATLINDKQAPNKK